MLSKIDTKKKLLLFPIIFLIIVILSGVVYSYWSNISNKRNDAAVKTEEFTQQVLKGRISVYQFLRSPNDKTAKKVKEDFELLNKDVLEFKSTLSLERNKILSDEIVSNSKKYIDFFDAFSNQRIKDFENGIKEESVEIKNIISQGEWLKHQSITGRNFSTGCIVYHAKPKSIQIHRKVEEFIEWIEIERKESMELLNKNNSNEYYLELKEPVKYEIIEDGYIYTKLEINLDYEKVLNILMGTELYDNPDIFLRELLQNSYDACKYYKEVFDKKDDEFTSYNPKVFIKYDSDNKILEVIDNGIGIDVETFENYVIKIGKSFYKSKYFWKYYNY